MGKPTGFIEYLRELPLDRKATERIKDWNEFPIFIFFICVMLRAMSLLPFKDLKPYKPRRFVTAAADLGDREEAERAYRRALSCAVDDGYCHLQYGAYLKRIGKLGRAKQYFRRAIALDPSLERAKRLLAELDHISSEPLP